VAIPAIALSIFIALDTEGCGWVTHALTAGVIAQTLNADVRVGVTHPCRAITVSQALDTDALSDIAHADRAVDALRAGSHRLFDRWARRLLWRVARSQADTYAEEEDT
jgi:hypothetical protein